MANLSHLFTECTKLKGQKIIIEVIIKKKHKHNFIGQIMPFKNADCQYSRAV